MNPDSTKTQNYSGTIIIAFFALVTFVVHLSVAKNFELHRDELLFVALGKNLDWGYASVPPFIGFLSYTAQLLFSDVPFGLKFFAALAGSGLIVIVGKITTELGGKNWAIFLACCAVALSPAYMATAALFQPVIFDILFWTLAAFYFIKLLKTQNENIWYWLILVCAIGFLNKYNIIFEISGFILALLISTERKLFLRKQFWIAAFIGILVVSPNIFWQVKNHFPVVYHMKELQRTQLSHLELSDFFFGQILDNLPALWLWVIPFIFVFVKKAENWLRIYIVASVITFLLFAFGGAKHYYTFGMYPTLIAIGGFIVEKYGITNVLKILKYAMALFMIVVSVFAAPIGLPILSRPNSVKYFQKIKPIIGNGLFTWEDRKVHNITQDYADETGWQELAKLVDSAYESLSNEEKLHCAIFCENYGEAGAVGLYSKNKILKLVSFSDSYLSWAPDSLNISTLIYVNDDSTEIKTHFETVTEFGRIENEYFRENHLPVFICRKPNDGWRSFYANKVAEIRKRKN